MRKIWCPSACPASLTPDVAWRRSPRRGERRVARGGAAPPLVGGAPIARAPAGAGRAHAGVSVRPAGAREGVCPVTRGGAAPGARPPPQSASTPLPAGAAIPSFRSAPVRTPVSREQGDGDSGTGLVTREGWPYAEGERLEWQ